MYRILFCLYDFSESMIDLKWLKFLCWRRMCFGGTEIDFLNTRRGRRQGQVVNFNFKRTSFGILSTSCGFVLLIINIIFHFFFGFCLEYKLIKYFHFISRLRFYFRWNFFSYLLSLPGKTTYLDSGCQNVTKIARSVIFPTLDTARTRYA